MLTPVLTELKQQLAWFTAVPQQSPHQIPVQNGTSIGLKRLQVLAGKAETPARQRGISQKTSSSLSPGTVRLTAEHSSALLKTAAIACSCWQLSSASNLCALSVPSNKRASAVEHYGEAAEQLLRDGDEDEWVAPPSEHPDLGSAEGETESIPHLASSLPQAASQAANNDDDIPDINDLELDEPEEVWQRC